uniref:NADH-ubiquinone oxidoreductase chain 6 n=1 Tax=Lithobius maqinensis TaxID=2250572 RepID=Q9G3Z8_9MYRI|nr:NADH dehydrogenase subunit 6 [Lithobius forficatus]AAG39995.1 NADH dehydrogenase subunit 6 [Lithobius forficatus]
MKYLLITLMLTMSLIITMTYISHPITLIFSLIIYTLLIAMMTSSMYSMFWYGYILILVFLGGMLILFLYVASIAPNEMFPSIPIKMISMSLALIIPLTLYLNKTSSLILWNTGEVFNSLIKLYNQNCMLMLFIVMYLLITLLIVVKITNFFKGPLRSL